MITNLNDLSKVTKQGWNQDLYFDYAIADWLYLRTGWDQDSYSIFKNRIRSGLKVRLTSWSPDQAKIRELGWSVRKVGSRSKKFFKPPRMFQEYLYFH